MTGANDPDRYGREPLTEQDRLMVSLIGRYVECRERGQAACTDDLFSVAAEFGDAAVAKLRTVLRVYEALLANDDEAR
jgi:hypothetical protein